MPTKSPWTKRFFVDCEFTDFAQRELLSLAIVSEEGDEFYVELSDYDEQRCSDFVRNTVLPQLGQYPGRVLPREQAAAELRAWLGTFPVKPRPVLSFDFVGDMELLADLIGAKPSGWKMQMLTGLRFDMEQTEAWFQTHGGRHHALMDARAKAASFR
jgi:hypothetical protein